MPTKKKKEHIQTQPEQKCQMPACWITQKCQQRLWGKDIFKSNCNLITNILTLLRNAGLPDMAPRLASGTAWWPGWQRFNVWLLLSSIILKPGGRNVLNPTINSFWPANSCDTRLITTGVSILRNHNKFKHLKELMAIITVLLTPTPILILLK